MRNYIGLMISIVAIQCVGITSSLFSLSQKDVYLKLNQPSFSPPGWVFGPVWLLLYTFMAIAAYRVYSLGISPLKVKFALLFFAIQLFLNFMWTIIFFRWQLRGLALLEIFVLLLFIILTTVYFFKIDSISGYLMIPYIIWVAFASLLNYSIWILNR